MWIVLTLTAAFSQAWWMAWSKSRLQTLRAQQFALFLLFFLLTKLIVCEYNI
jgi:hypothetical protein